MNAQTAARQTSAPQTPSLPHAKPEALGLSAVRLQRMSDAFKREIDKGTLPGATVLVARRGQIGWFDFHRADDLIAHGARAAERAIESIQEAIHILTPAPIATPNPAVDENT